LAYETLSEQLGPALANASEEVLETMFFTTISPRPDVPDFAVSGDSLLARVRFHGNPSGFFLLHIFTSAACVVAENFFGAEPDSISTEQVSEVVRELANMICGSVLTRFESDTVFRLEAPELLSTERASEIGFDSNWRHFDVENGSISVYLWVN
jgi:CheY-specific phosphatase CheX